MSSGETQWLYLRRIKQPLAAFILFLAILAALLLAVPAHAGHLNLGWTAPSTNTDGSQLTDLASYRIYYGTGSGACGGASSQTLAAPLPNPIPGTVVSYQLAGLTTGTPYYIQVSAVDTGGNESACSNEVSAAALADGADTTAPTGAVVINSNAASTPWTAATLTLTASDLVGVTGYYVSSSATVPTAGAAGWVAVTSTTSYSNAAVPFTLATGDGTKTVYAWYKDAAGNVSATASDTIVLDQTAPTTGTLTATAGSWQVALSWTGCTDGGSGLAATNPYKVVFATGSAPAAACTSGTQIYQGTGTSYTHTGLTAGTLYYYRVCAVDNAGNTAAGATASATPQVGTDPTPPTVSITSPTTGATYSTSSSPLTLGGTAADNVSVASVTWSNDRGGSGTATGTTAWTASGIALQSGANVLTVTARDPAGNPASTTLTVTYTPPDITTGLLAAYNFNEGVNSTAADASGNGHTGSLAGGVTWTPSGKYGNAVTFDGTSGYVSVASPNLPTADYTWAMWVNPTQTSTFQALLVARGLGVSPGGLELDLDAGGKVVVWANGALGLTSTTALPAGAWSHVALTRAGGTLRLYLNGTLDPATGTNAVAHDFSTCPLLIGVDNDSGCTGALNGYFAGRLDELRIYGRALSQAEMQAAMTTPIAGAPADTTPPTLSITSPTANPTYSTSSSPLSLGGTAADTNGVAAVSWANDRGGSGSATGTTAWTASGIPLQPGSNVLTITAADAAGNIGTATLTVTYTPLDTTPPAGALTINSGAAATNATSATLTLTATDAVAVTGYYVSSSATVPTAGAAGWVAVTSTTSYAGTVAFTLPTGDGPKTVYAWFKDAAGNVSATASDTIVLDQTAPTNGTLAATAGSGQVALTCAGFADSGSGLAPTDTYKVVFATGSTPAASCTTGTQVYLGTGTSYTHTGLTNGTTYYYRACATDSAGNLSTGATASATPQAADTTAPTGSVSLNAGAPATNAPSATLTLSATDTVGITGYYVSASSTAPTAGAAGWVAVAATTSYAANVSFTLATGDGPKAVYAWYKDAAGNVSATASDTIVLDQTAPTVSLTAPTPGQTLSGTVTVSANAADAAGIAGVQFKLDGTNLGGEVVASPYSLSWNTTTVANGPHTLSAVVRDGAGNTATSNGVGVTTSNIGPPPTTTVTLQPAADTFLNTNTDVNAASQTLNTYTWPDNMVANAILMDFDLSAIPVGSTVQTATLNLSLIESDATADATYTVTVHKIINKNPDLSQATGSSYDGTNAWTANTCCYGNIPIAQADISTAYDTKSLDKTLGYKQWNLAQMVQEWVNAPATNFGVLVNADPSKLSDRYRYFASSEHPTSSIRPFLTVTYQGSSATDTTPPSVTITSPTAGSSYSTSSSSLNLGGTASDNVGVTSVVWANDRGGSGSATGTTAWTASGIPLQPGSNVLTITAADTAGNTGTATLTVTYTPPDTTPPACAITINAGAATTNTTGATLNLSATDAVGVTGYYVSANSAPPTAGAAGWVALTSTTSYAANVSFTLSTGDGPKTVYAWYKDAAGNLSAAAFDTILLDTTPPSDGTITATPGDNQLTLNWSGFSDGGSGLAGGNTYKLVFRSNNFPTASCTNGTQIYQGTGTSFTHTGRTNGTTYYYRLCATDAAGNLSAGATVSAAPQAPVQVTVNKKGKGKGKVASTPNGIDCGAACTGTYAYSSNVTLTAIADPGYAFAGWSGDCTGTGACVVTASQARTVTATFSRAFTFTDELLVPGTTPVKAVHISELRAAVDSVRSGYGLPAYTWTDPTLVSGTTTIKSVHLTDMRIALNQAYAAAGQATPTYTDATVQPGATPIKAAHLNELRALVRALP